MAAAITLLLARWLPIRFEYHENDLGIVSVATVNRYPIVQETFWLAFGLVVGALVAWAIARELARYQIAGGDAIVVEALSIGSLIGMLLLPGVLADLSAIGGCASAWVFARSRGMQVEPALGEAQDVPARPTWVNALWTIGVVVVSLALTRALWLHLWNVMHGVPDEKIVVDNFKFLGETGQHLAWANALRHGWFQGRDVFCLYGPLYDLGLVGFWALIGKSVAGWNLYWSLTRVLAWTSLFALGGALVKNRVALLWLPFLLPWIELRVGFALFAACFLFRWLASDRRLWLIFSGGLTGISMLYSQEYGTAIWLAALVGFAIRRDGRAVLVYGGGMLATMAPLFIYYGVHGALLPMLNDVAQYPAYLIAGYAKLPFPNLAANLPIGVSELSSRTSEALRLGYAVPAICLGGLLLLLPVSGFDVRHPLRSVRELADGLARDPVRLMMFLIAIFGMIAFRSAMGRASLHRTHSSLPAVALLLCFALDRAISVFREQPRIATWRIVTLAVCFGLGGFWQTASPLSDSWRSLRFGVQTFRIGHRPRGDQHVMRVTRWVQLNTKPNEPVLFLPNDAAYYYLTDRPNPIRFVMGHQMVGDAHRAEVIADLNERPPRFIVWDDHALRVDDLSDELVFGPEILAFIQDEYQAEKQFGEVTIYRHRGLTDAGLIADW
jgi:hypothetical protein